MATVDVNTHYRPRQRHQELLGLLQRIKTIGHDGLADKVASLPSPRQAHLRLLAQPGGELIGKIVQFVATNDKSKALCSWSTTADSIPEKLHLLCSQTTLKAPWSQRLVAGREEAGFWVDNP